jgi:DNA-binding MarR family transcriptional regulator
MHELAASELLANKIAALATAIDDRTDAAFGSQRSRSSVAALETLLYWGPLTATELSKILKVTQPTAVRVVGGLVREGLITRHRKRGRDVALALSRAGNAQARRLQRARLAAVAELVGTLAAANAQSVNKVIDLLLAAATDGRTTARRTCRFCAHDICEGLACPVGSRATVLEGELKERRRGDRRA